MAGLGEAAPYQGRQVLVRRTQIQCFHLGKGGVPALTFPAAREQRQGSSQAVISESNKNTASFSETSTCLGLP